MARSRKAADPGRDGEQRRQLVAQALAAHPPEGGGGAGGGLERRGVRGHVETPRQPRQTQDPQRIIVECGGRTQAKAARSQIVDPAQRVDHGTAGDWPRHRVDGEVPSQQVGP